MNLGRRTGVWFAGVSLWSTELRERVGRRLFYVVEEAVGNAEFL